MRYKTYLILIIYLFVIPCQGARYYRDAVFFCPNKLPTKSHGDTVAKISFDILFTALGMVIPGVPTGAVKNVIAVKGAKFTQNLIQGYAFGETRGTGESLLPHSLRGKKVSKCEIKFHKRKGKTKKTIKPGQFIVLKFANRYDYFDKKNKKKTVKIGEFPKKIQIKVDIKGGKDLHFSAQAPDLSNPKQKHKSWKGSTKGWFRYVIHDNGKGGLSWRDAQKIVNTMVLYPKTQYRNKRLRVKCHNYIDKKKIRNCRLEYFNKEGKLIKTKIGKGKSKTIELSPYYGLKHTTDVRGRDTVVTWRVHEGIRKIRGKWGNSRKPNTYINNIKDTNLVTIRETIQPNTKFWAAFAALKGEKVNKITKAYGVTRAEVKKWSKKLRDSGPGLFD